MNTISRCHNGTLLLPSHPFSQKWLYTIPIHSAYVCITFWLDLSAWILGLSTAVMRTLCVYTIILSWLACSMSCSFIFPLGWMLFYCRSDTSNQNWNIKKNSHSVNVIAMLILWKLKTNSLMLFPVKKNASRSSKAYFKRINIFVYFFLPLLLAADTIATAKENHYK